MLYVVGQLLQGELQALGLGRLGEDAVDAEVPGFFREIGGFLGGAHDNRNAGGVRVALDGLGGLYAVHAGHQVIHEDHIRAAVVFQEVQGFLGRACHVHFHVTTLEQFAESKPGYLGVVHKQSILDWHVTSSTCYC